LELQTKRSCARKKKQTRTEDILKRYERKSEDGSSKRSKAVTQKQKLKPSSSARTERDLWEKGCAGSLHSPSRHKNKSTKHPAIEAQRKQTRQGKLGKRCQVTSLQKRITIPEQRKTIRKSQKPNGGGTKGQGSDMPIKERSSQAHHPSPTRKKTQKKPKR